MDLKLLIVDDEPDIVSGLQLVLKDLPLEIVALTDPVKARGNLEAGHFDIVICDIAMPSINGFELLQFATERDPDIVFIMITGYGSVESAVSAMRAGAYHYLQKPFSNDEILHATNLAVEKANLVREIRYLRQQVSETHALDRMIGKSGQMQEFFRLVEKIAPTDASVLILGESGTGKELTARAIHELSPRRDKTFVAINTTALTETLLESELFGYKKGSFTGADRDKQGLFEVSSGGTLFLDEIGRMPLNFQDKLLRALQEREVIPVGGSEPVSFDSRIISATNTDLKSAVMDGRFREDLYFRLNVIELKIPPLRDRIEDLPLLAEYFIQKFCEQQRLPHKSLSTSARRILMSYGWPGNVRELENVIQRAVVISESNTLTAGDLFLDTAQVTRVAGDSEYYNMRYADAKADVLGNFQREYAQRLLAHHQGNISQASRASGLTRAALYQIIKKYNLKV
ncbi:MAG: sigma-54-dependent transcriptional regulator [Planctomycetota bacterium]|jgi:DNA-binding NtrC family response regulator